MTDPKRVHIEDGWANDGYGSYRYDHVVNDPDGDLITSNLGRGYAFGDHLVLIDLDLPAHLVPSKTPGHHHLIIDKPLTWRKYKRLLRALMRAGLVEREWYHLVKRRGEALLAVDPIWLEWGE